RRTVLRTTLALVSGLTTATSCSVSAWARVAGLRISTWGSVVIRLVSVTIRSVFPVRFRLDGLVFFARFIVSSLPFVPGLAGYKLETAPEARGCTGRRVSSLPDRRW